MPTLNPEHNETPPLTYEAWIAQQSEEDQEQILELYHPNNPMFKNTSDQGKIYVATRFLPPRNLTPPKSYLLDAHDRLRANDTQISRHSFTAIMEKANRRALDEAQQGLGALETKSIEV